MANCRPAGLSDEDTDSDDGYGFFDKLNSRNRNYPIHIENTKQKIETKLQEAIINGDFDGFANIISIDLKDDINAVLESKWTPLSHACFHGQENIVQYLLDKGADPNIHADSVTPLMMACSNTSSNEAAIFNIVSNLILKDCILNFGDKYGVTPLMRAVISGRACVVQLLLDKNINIEMRDRQGWTAIFWAIHHNQPQCLDILLSKGARLNIVDTSNRTPLQIAYSHDYDEILSTLKKYEHTDEDDDLQDEGNIIKQKNSLEYMTYWKDYYPGLMDENKPKYSNEIAHLLYGMNCDRLKKIFENVPLDLRTFLLLEEDHMLKLGIELPFERQRLKIGLRGFHTRSWKVNAVAGLQIRRNETYSIIECLKVLGTHLQQIYILESTLTYILRDYTRIQDQLKFEPPDSPSKEKLHKAVKKMLANINSVRSEIKAMTKLHTKISKDSLKPVDLITEKTRKELIIERLTELLMVGSLGLLVYHAKGLITNMLQK